MLKVVGRSTQSTVRRLGLAEFAWAEGQLPCPKTLNVGGQLQRLGAYIQPA